jgi:Ser/Thr protein kinase RdoA (MazF antagonist)
VATKAATTFVERGPRLSQLEPWKPGTAIESGPSIGQAGAAAATLSCLHRLLEPQGTRGLSPGLVRRLEILVCLQNGGFDRLARAIEAAPLSEASALARAWLTRAGSRLDPVLDALSQSTRNEWELQPCLRDCRAAHWLFTREEVTGLVDFGAMNVDARVFDLARLRLDWWPDDCNGGESFRAEYERHNALPVSASDLLPIIEQTTAYLSGANWIRWHFLEHRTFERPGAVAAGLARSLRWIDSRLPVG